MASTKQIAANRRNGHRSTGPKTEEGKAVSRTNATRHGILSAVQVLPGQEDPDEWTTHLEALLEDLSPAGYLERVLVERIAIQLWRLRRVVRYEREVAAVELEKLPERLKERHTGVFGHDPRLQVIGCTPEDAELSLADCRDTLDLIATLPNLPEKGEVKHETAIYLIWEVAGHLSIDIDSDPKAVLPEVPEGTTLEELNWDAGRLRQALETIVKAADDHLTLNEVLGRTANEVNQNVEMAKTRLHELVRERDQETRLSILPDESTLEKVGRYETHLERSLYKALHELQRLQAARAGPIPPPVAVDVDLSVSGQGKGN